MEKLSESLDVGTRSWNRASVRAHQLEHQAIEGRLHVGRQPRLELLVVEIGVQVGQDRPARLDPLDPAERVGDAEMARMRAVAQRVHDPDLESLQRRDAPLRQATEVARVGKRTETEAPRGDIAVLLPPRAPAQQHALPTHRTTLT